MNADTARPVFVHLGLEKTGSTFMQRVLLPNLTGVCFHRKSRFARFEEILKSEPKKIHLFSFETDRQLVETAYKIADTRPDARIILILRRQDHWLRSKYNYHIRKHGTLTLEQFFDIKNNQGFVKLDELYFRQRIEFLDKLFSHPVLYLDNEELHTSPERFVQRIEEYTGAKVRPDTNLRRRSKPAFTLKQNRILLKLNRLYPYSHLGTSSRFLNRAWYKYREFLLHTIAFIARLIPQSWVSTVPLIDFAYMEEIRKIYSDDWDYAISKIYGKSKAAE